MGKVFPAIVVLAAIFPASEVFKVFNTRTLTANMTAISANLALGVSKSTHQHARSDVCPLAMSAPIRHGASPHVCKGVHVSGSIEYCKFGNWRILSQSAVDYPRLPLRGGDPATAAEGEGAAERLRSSSCRKSGSEAYLVRHTHGSVQPWTRRACTGHAVPDLEQNEEVSLPQIRRLLWNLAALSMESMLR